MKLIVLAALGLVGCHQAAPINVTMNNTVASEPPMIDSDFENVSNASTPARPRAAIDYQEPVNPTWMTPYNGAEPSNGAN